MTPVATWALVPAKSFARAKSRLAERLGQAQRADFARAMLEHVLATLRACEAIGGVLVVTDGDDVAEVASARGAAVVRDATQALRGAAGPPLGSIVDAALLDLRARGADAALVIMSDLPKLVPAEVAEFAAKMATADVVVAPDLRGEGTNALGLRPPVRFPTAFGTRDSFARHLRLAQAAGLSLDIHRSRGLGFDVDELADLDELNAEPLRQAASR
jgi:2-phospho-L-lactate guanylyltransferase